MQYRIVYPAIPFVAIVVLWASADTLGIPPFLLPSLPVVLEEFDQRLLQHFTVTMTSTALGLAGVITLTLSSVTLFRLIPAAEWTIFPYVLSLKVMPLIAVIPILLIWIGAGMPASVVAAVLITLYPLLVLTVRGTREVAEDQRCVCLNFSKSRWRMLVEVELPNAVPYIFSGLWISVPGSLAGVLVVELFAPTAGLGYVIAISYPYLDTARMFAALLLLLMGGTAFIIAIEVVRRVFFWRFFESLRSRRYGV